MSIGSVLHCIMDITELGALPAHAGNTGAHVAVRRGSVAALWTLTTVGAGAALHWCPAFLASRSVPSLLVITAWVVLASITAVITPAAWQRRARRRAGL